MNIDVYYFSSLLLALVALMEFIYKVHQDKKITATFADVTVIVIIIDLSV